MIVKRNRTEERVFRMDCAGLKARRTFEGDDMTEAGTAAVSKAARIAKFDADACPCEASSVVPSIGRTAPSSATSRLKSAPPPG